VGSEDGDPRDSPGASPKAVAGVNKHIYYPSSEVHNIRNHDDTINMGKLIEEETNKVQKDKMIRETGMISQKKTYILQMNPILIIITLLYRNQRVQ
jgi:hypothetical protein